MVSDEMKLEWTALDNSLQIDAKSELRFRVTGRKNKKLSFDDNDEIKLSVGDLKAQTTWQDTVEVVGRSEGSLYKWERDKTTTDPLVFYPPEVNDVVDEVDFILSNIQAKVEGEAQLKIELTINEVSYENSFPIYLLQQAPKIKKFRATPTILVKGADTDLEWYLENSLVYEIRDKAYKKIELPDQTKHTLRLSINEENFAPFHLIARHQKALTTKTVEIRVFSESRWQSGWQPDEGQISGLIASSAGEEIFAIVRGKTNSVWRSPDGLSNWQMIDDDVPIDMVTSPGVHFNNQLVLVGGSKIDPNQVSHEVHRFDLKARKWSKLPMPGESDEIWEQRMGHACIVFPDQDGTQKVWVMGGANKYSNALNDIWVWDGSDKNVWIKKEKKNVEKSRPWPVRCMFGACPVGNEIWIGGGFEQPQGKGLDDIWIGDGQTWQRLKRQTGDLKIIDSGFLCAATLVSLGKDVYFLGAKKDNHYKALFANMREQRHRGKEYDWYDPPTPIDPLDWTLKRPDFMLEAVGFNGCIWLISQAYRGKKRVENSGLYYWIPPKGSTIV